jgi:PAS domain S-box-containing protein
MVGAKSENDISGQKSDERVRQVVESAPCAMVMIAASGLIEMVNTQTERVFGYSRGELLGRPVEMLVPERFRRDHPTLRTSFFAAPVSRPMGAGRDLYGLRKDGSEFPVEIGLNPIETDDGSMVLSAIVDISARKQLEERFRRVVESAPNAMVMIDRNGLIVMVNTQTERVFGYSRGELLGRPVEMLVPERYRRDHPALRTSFFSAPTSRPMGIGRDLYGRRKDGSEFPVEIGLNPIDADEGIMVLSAIVDISDRKEKEERIRTALRTLAQMNRVATAGELTASIAHEVGQPLAAMVTNANAGLRWLTKRNLDEVQTALTQVVSAGHRASEVIRSVRSMFDREGSERTPVELNDLINEVLRLAYGELQAQGIVVETDLSGTLPLVPGHRGQLQQVILNLVTNAADAMETVPDRPRTLRIKSVVQDANSVLVSIADSGTGINPRDIDRIFESFFTTKSKGMGMGLSICRSIIEAHDGRLWASSDFGHGSVFNIQMPAVGP